MRANLVKFVAFIALAGASASCGEFTREGKSPVVAVVRSLTAASGAVPDELAGNLLSDVITFVTRPAPCTEDSPCPTIYNDVAEVSISLVLKDPGSPGVVATPSPLNSVTFDRYRVTYIRTDGRNTPGVDVPYGFDSGLTFTVPADGTASAGFEIVRHSAKREAPLRALAYGIDKISTIAEVSFYGRDQAGNEVMASAKIGIDFGDFADPQ